MDSSCILFAFCWSFGLLDLLYSPSSFLSMFWLSYLFFFVLINSSESSKFWQRFLFTASSTNWFASYIFSCVLVACWASSVSYVSLTPLQAALPTEVYEKVFTVQSLSSCSFSIFFSVNVCTWASFWPSSSEAKAELGLLYSLRSSLWLLCSSLWWLSWLIPFKVVLLNDSAACSSLWRF